MEDDQTWSFRGSKSRNKVSVGEPAEGSLLGFERDTGTAALALGERHTLLSPDGRSGRALRARADHFLLGVPGAVREAPLSQGGRRGEHRSGDGSMNPPAPLLHERSGGIKRRVGSPRVRKPQRYRCCTLVARTPAPDAGRRRGKRSRDRTLGKPENEKYTSERRITRLARR